MSTRSPASTPRKTATTTIRSSPSVSSLTRPTAASAARQSTAPSTPSSARTTPTKRNLSKPAPPSSPTPSSVRTTSTKLSPSKPALPSSPDAWIDLGSPSAFLRPSKGPAPISLTQGLLAGASPRGSGSPASPSTARQSRVPTLTVTVKPQRAKLRKVPQSPLYSDRFWPARGREMYGPLAKPRITSSQTKARSKVGRGPRSKSRTRQSPAPTKRHSVRAGKSDDPVTARDSTIRLSRASTVSKTSSKAAPNRASVISMNSAQPHRVAAQPKAKKPVIAAPTPPLNIRPKTTSVKKPQVAVASRTSKVAASSRPTSLISISTKRSSVSSLSSLQKRVPKAVPQSKPSTKVDPAKKNGPTGGIASSGRTGTPSVRPRSFRSSTSAFSLVPAPVRTGVSSASAKAHVGPPAKAGAAREGIVPRRRAADVPLSVASSLSLTTDRFANKAKRTSAYPPPANGSTIRSVSTSSKSSQDQSVPTSTPSPRTPNLSSPSPKNRQGLYLQLDLRPAPSSDLPRSPCSSLNRDMGAERTMRDSGVDFGGEAAEEADVLGAMLGPDELLAPTTRSRWSRDSSPGWLHPPTPSASLLLGSASSRPPSSTHQPEVNAPRGRTMTTVASLQALKRITVGTRPKRTRQSEGGKTGVKRRSELGGQWMVIESWELTPAQVKIISPSPKQATFRAGVKRTSTKSKVSSVTAGKTAKRRPGSDAARSVRPVTGYDWEEIKMPTINEVYEYVSFAKV